MCIYKIKKWLGKKNKNKMMLRFWYSNNSKPIGNSYNLEQSCKLRFWSAFNWPIDVLIFFPNYSTFINESSGCAQLANRYR